MTDILGTIKSVIPSFNAATVSNIVIMIVGTILVVIIAGCAFFWWFYSYTQKKRFNIKISLFEKVNGRYINTRMCKAMELNYSDSGEKAIFIKELKRYRAKPTAQSGTNTYWLALDDEGNLINFTMPDIDVLQREMKIETTETESRANRIAFQKALGDRLKKKESFWDKYGKTIMNIIFIIVATLAIIYILAEVGKILGTIANLDDKQAILQEGQNKILTGLDNIVSRMHIV